MEKSFKTLGFAAIAIGLMAMPMDSVFAQEGNNNQLNLNACLTTLKRCVNDLTPDASIPEDSRAGQIANIAKGCVESYKGCIKTL